MILELKVKNYRSYREETVFTMEANSYTGKASNVANVTTADGKDLRVLKTAMFFGANASGKSNVIRVFFELRRLITKNLQVGDELKIYDPFKFEEVASNAPCFFELTFLGKDSIKYVYKLEVFKNEIIQEKLSYSPKGKSADLFVRKINNESDSVHTGVVTAGGKKREIKVFPNQTILSKFGNEEPHEILTDVFLYFRTTSVINSTSLEHHNIMRKKVSTFYYDNEIAKEKLNKLIRFADTKINSINISVIDPSLSLEESIRKKDNHNITGLHTFYKGDKEVGTVELNIKEESLGTQMLYALGGEILALIEMGGNVIVDELDTSLHPYLAKLIVLMFQSKEINKHNSQLIFTSHDTTLLDRDHIRRDQIWFSEKNEKGESDLYSLRDFEEVRETTPFDKWYLSGRFGAVPDLKSVNSLFD